MTPVEVQQYIQAITTGLSPLGEKVATGAKEYYALAYRQSILDGVEALVACGAALFVLWRIWKGYERAKAKDEYCEKEGWFFCAYLLIPHSWNLHRCHVLYRHRSHRQPRLSSDSVDARVDYGEGEVVDELATI